jgi:hypothetical protein
MKALMALATSILLAVACGREGADVPAQPEPQEATCRFSLSRCEAEANEECQYAGFTVLGSYRTNSMAVVPYYHMKYVCGRHPANATASAAPPASPPVASVEAAWVAPVAPSEPAARPADSGTHLDPSWQ